MSRVLEIRTYRLKPGMGEAFHRLMQTRCLPLLRAWGMDVVRAGPCRLEAEGYVLLRAFEDAGHLQASQDAFYGSDGWRLGPREEVLACIEMYCSVVLELEEAAIRAIADQGPE